MASICDGDNAVKDARLPANAALVSSIVDPVDTSDDRLASMLDG